MNIDEIWKTTAHTETGERSKDILMLQIQILQMECIQAFI